MNDLLHSFPGQQKNEPVYVFARPYPVAFLPTALVFFLLFFFSLLGQIGLLSGAFGDFNNQLIDAGILFFGAFQLFILVVFLAALMDFYFDIVIVTDRRLVDIDQDMLFFRRISELGMEDVEDVTSVVKGFLGTVFNYGQVEIQTAGAKDNFSMENVRYPREITAIVLDLSQQAKASIPEDKRVPESEVLAVLDNQPLTTLEQLEAKGAILPTDLRRVNRTSSP